jgi:hypothetical protein
MQTTYLDEAGNEMSVDEFHKLVKSRAHGDSGLKQLEANIRQSFKVRCTPRRGGGGGTPSGRRGSS